MSRGNARSNVRFVTDVLLTAGLLLLMTYQVTGEEAHEWTGVAMTALMLWHQVLNRRWYAALFRGRYTAARIVRTAVNGALVVCFAVTALSGVSMSVYALPALADFMRASTGQVLHLGLSHWCFMLMGLHRGLHLGPRISAPVRKNRARAVWAFALPAAGAGLYFFLRRGYPEYLLFRRHFPLIDYELAAPWALAESALIACFAVVLGILLHALLSRGKSRGGRT